MFLKLLLYVFFLILPLSMHVTRACESDCVNENSWSIGLALGHGSYSNPLHNSEERNVSILPSFYYYGESFYIENTEIGYVIEENENWMLTLKGKFNNDGLYFNKTKFDSVFASGLLGPGQFEEPDESVSANEVERDYSYMAGFGATYFFSDNLKLTAGAYHDITEVHHGLSLSTSAHYFWESGNWQIQAGITIEHKSRELSNYYYGLRPEDGTSYANFDVKSQTNPSFSHSISYRLSDNFYLIGRYYYEWLDSEMTISPLVEDSNTQFFFMGITGQVGSN